MEDVVYELRSYRVTPGRLAEVLDNAVRFALPGQERHGFDVVGFWTVTEGGTTGAGDDAPDLVYLLRWPSRDARERAWQEFLADPEWQARQAQTDARTPLVASETITFLTPTPFSGLR